MTIDEAVRYLRARPEYAELVSNAYLGEDVHESARRFAASSEFAEVKRLVGNLGGATVVDLGAGNGIASYAFAVAGASAVYAVEPDPSDEVGAGAIGRLRGSLPITVVDGYGESIPLPDGVADVIYARQVLHHTRDLDRTLRECARLLRPGGVFLACREHVVDDEQQLEAFLASHPMHKLAGGENAYRLEEYQRAIRGAGFEQARSFGPWESPINSFPFAGSHEELRDMPRRLLKQRFGRWGDVLARVPGVKPLIWWRLGRPLPGRLYTFWARKA